ncbi:MAG: hypothetical protein AAFR59_01695 [Bacteroidota bacterium]
MNKTKKKWLGFTLLGFALGAMVGAGMMMWEANQAMQMSEFATEALTVLP